MDFHLHIVQHLSACGVPFITLATWHSSRVLVSMLSSSNYLCVSFTFSSCVCVFLIWVLWFPLTTQKHASRWIQNSKNVPRCEWMCMMPCNGLASHPGVFLLCAQYSQDWLQFNHHSDHDKGVTKDEWVKVDIIMGIYWHYFISYGSNWLFIISLNGSIPTEPHACDLRKCDLFWQTSWIAEIGTEVISS